jgi:hypothetical protein
MPDFQLRFGVFVPALPQVRHFKIIICNLVSALGVLVMLAGAGPATAEAQARLMSGGGRIEVIRQGASAQAMRNQMFLENDRLRTGPGAFAWLDLGMGSRAVLSENTEVELQAAVGSIRVLFVGGTLRMVSSAPMTVATGDGEFASVGGFLDMKLSYQEARLTFAIAKGSVNTIGLTPNVTVASAEDKAVRTYISGRHSYHKFDPVPHRKYPNLNIYPNAFFSPRPRGYSY